MTSVTRANPLQNLPMPPSTVPAQDTAPAPQALVPDGQTLRVRLYEGMAGPLHALDALLQACPSHDWPRWSAEHPLPEVLLPPHDLLGRLVQHPSWDDAAAQPVLLAALDRLIDEGEPIDRLVLAGGDVPPDRAEWRTPLQWATMANRMVVVERLLDRGADPSIGGWHRVKQEVRHLQHNALITAAGFGSLAMVERLLATGVARDVTVRTWGQGPRARRVAYSALHAAVRREDRSNDTMAETCAILTTLVNAGVPLNQPHGGPDSALHQAIEDAPPLVVEHLLALGADPDRPNQEGVSAWGEAQRQHERWEGKTPQTQAGEREKARATGVFATMLRHRIREEQRVLHDVCPDVPVKQAHRRL